MIECFNYFNSLHFVDCNFDKIEIGKSRIIIKVENLGILKEHPLNDSNQLKMINRCSLIFEDVVSSEREIYEYIGAPTKDGFKDKYLIKDEIENTLLSETSEFEFEGVLNEPKAWINWKIKSREVILRIDETGNVPD